MLFFHDDDGDHDDDADDDDDDDHDDNDWLVVHLPLWNILVSWDDYSQYMESHKNHVPNHQPAIQWDFTTQITITNPIPWFQSTSNNSWTIVV